MFNFGKKKPAFKSDAQEDLTLDGSGKVSEDGRRLWRFFSYSDDESVGSEVTINGRSARIVESSSTGGYVEFD